MRSIPENILNRLLDSNQTIANNADPKMKIRLSRGFNSELFEVFTIEEDDNLSDLDVAVSRPETTSLPAKLYAFTVKDGIANVLMKELPFDYLIPWVDEFTISSNTNAEIIDLLETDFTSGTLNQVAADGSGLKLDEEIAGGSGANIIPTMTSNTLPSGIASASTEFSSTYAAWKAMDKTAAEYWSNKTGSLPAWLAYEFISTKILGGYAITARADAADGSPKNWTFEGWDGSQWVVLDTRSNESFTNGQKKEYTFTNSAAYLKYRINISANNGRSTVNIAEIEMMELAAGQYYTSGSRISTATSIDSTDDAATEISWDSIESANTSVKIYVGYNSSDSTPPSTWHECTNNGSLPNYPADTTGMYLWLKQELQTTDTSVTPILESVSINIEMSGTGQLPMTGVSSVAIEFDGYWDRDYHTRRFNLVTDDFPWLFYVKAGNLYSQYWQDEPTIIATDVTKVAAIRGWVPVAGDTTNDQGLIVSYLKSDGTMWYKGYCIQSDGSKAWDIEREITELTSEGEITDLALFRTNDFRIGFMGEIDGEIWWTLTERNYAGMSYWPELLTGKFGGFTAIDLIEIEYADTYHDEHLTGSYGTLCVGLNLETDAVGTCTGGEITGDSEITLKFSQKLAGNISRIKDLITVSDETLTVYYTPVSTVIGSTQYELKITVAEPLDTENASKITVGDATIYLQPSGQGSLLPVAPFNISVSLLKDPYHLVNLTGKFNMITVALTEITYHNTANQDVASLAGTFGGFTQIILTKVGTGDV